MPIRNKYEYEVVDDRKVIETCRCIYGRGKRMDTLRILVREGSWWFGREMEGSALPPLDEEWTIPTLPKSAYWFCTTNHPFVVKRVAFGLTESIFRSLSPRKKQIAAAFVWEREWDSSISMGVTDLRMILPYLDPEIQEWVKDELGDPFGHRYDGHYPDYLPADRKAKLDQRLGRSSKCGVRPEATWRF